MIKTDIIIILDLNYYYDFYYTVPILYHKISDGSGADLILKILLQKKNLSKLYIESFKPILYRNLKNYS